MFEMLFKDMEPPSQICLVLVPCDYKRVNSVFFMLPSVEKVLYELHSI